uniref:Uncharacterized protein n=1 Tax=Anopheles farauti TaxID=69004 RepID=A0A182QEC6_9DIPT
MTQTATSITWLCVFWWTIALGKCTAGSYLRDVELIAPSPQAELNTVYYYPSYVKGEDPVEEYNRRRLHVDTGDFMEPEETEPIEREAQSQRQQQADDGDGADCCAKVKRKRKHRARPRGPPRPDPVRVVDAQTDHEYNYLQIRQATGGPRYVRDDVEIFDIDRGRGGKKPRPIRRRRTRMTTGSGAKTQVRNGPRRYEESDPQVFAYERSDPDPIGRANSNRPGATEDSQYFQFAEIFGDGSFAAGARRGNDQHYVEQLERGSHGVGVFQKKVKWADKKGGFGEHYWDLNHIQPSEHSHRSPTFLL